MPLSKEFIEVFSQLTQNYTGYSSSSMLSWRDKDFEPISIILKAHLDLINNENNTEETPCNEDYINDFARSAVLLKDSDPSFLTSCKEFLLNSIRNKIIPDTNITKGIYIDPDSKKNSQFDLINSMSTIIHNMQIVQNTQRLEYEKLRMENEALKKQLREQVLVQSEIGRLEEVKSLILALNEVMGLCGISQFALPLDNSPILDESLENNVSPVFMPNYPPPAPPLESEILSATVSTIHHANMPNTMQDISSSSSSSLEDNHPSRLSPIPPPPVKNQTPASSSRTSAARIEFFAELKTKIQPLATKYEDAEKKSSLHQGN